MPGAAPISIVDEITKISYDPNFKSQGSAMATYLAHNQEIPGSTPGPATNLVARFN